MTQEKALELTLCGMLPYGLQIKCDNFPIATELINVGIGRIKVKDYDTENAVGFLNKHAKPLLHSMEKLIKNILEDENDYFYKLNCDLCDILGVADCEYFVNSIIEKRYYAVNLITVIESLEWLKANHFNIYHLDKSKYLEKSEVNTTK